jgi:hypothetical protein
MNQHPSERGFTPGPVTAWSVTAGGQYAPAWSRCYCFSSSRSSTSAATEAASDNADIVGTGAATRVGDFSDSNTVLNLTEGAKLTTGVDVAGANIGGNVNVTTADPELVGKALDEVTRLSSGFSGTVADLNKGVLDKISELALSQQTQGETERNKTILYIALAGLGVLGIWAYRKS